MKKGIVSFVIALLFAGAGIWAGASWKTLNQSGNSKIHAGGYRVTGKNVGYPGGSGYVARKTAIAGGQDLMARLRKGIPQDGYKKLFDEIIRSPLRAELMEDTAFFLFMHEWARVSPKLALEEIGKMGGNIQLPLVALFDGWSISNPEEAWKYFLETEEPMIKNNLVLLLPLSTGGSKAPESTWKHLARYFEEKGDKQLFPMFTTQFITGMIHNHPEKLKNFVNEFGEKEVLNESNAAMIAETWATQDYEETREWIAGLPEKWQPEAMARAMTGAFKEDEQALSREMENLPEAQRESVRGKILSQQKK